MSNLPNGKLTPLQENFCHEYLIDLHPGGAYVRAGYRSTTKAGAKRNGSVLLSYHKIQQRIQQLTRQRNRSTDVTAERVLEELGRMGFSNILDLARWDSTGVRWKDSDDVSRDVAASIAEIQENERVLEDGTIVRTKKIKLHDKMPPLRELAKHTGISGPAGVGVNVNVNLHDEQEKAKAGEMESLFAEIDKWRGRSQEEAPEVPEAKK